ncbi:MAG: DUF1801 domain-containing protein [Rhodobacteraceae bacterium]|nr:DUF1801 domain-containing protein [Paracoccaceae bacterium]
MNDTPDAYLARLPAPQRDALQALRAVLRAALPGAAECISYAMPGFRMPGGKMVAGYAAFSRHLGLYPHSGGVIPGFAAECAALGFKTSKSGVLFTPDHPLPDDLVRRILAARLAEIG